MARGPSLDLRAQIDARIAAQPDAVWTPVDFLDLGSRAAVDKALQRLARGNGLSRVDRGLYHRPGANALTGKATTPDVRAIVDAVARRDQTRVVVDGLTAANDLGLTTAVPARVTVLTDARLRPIKLGKQQIIFKSVAPSRLYWAGRPAMRVVQALHWLHDVIQSDRAALLKRLRAVVNDPAHGASVRDDLRSGLRTLPTRMQPLVRQLVTDEARAAAIETELEETLRRVKAYRQADPDFESAISKFTEAEAELAAKDPVEGQATRARVPGSRR